MPKYFKFFFSKKDAQIILRFLVAIKTFELIEKNIMLYIFSYFFIIYLTQNKK